jgi:hypothetical protein
LLKSPEKSFSTATGDYTSLRRLFAPSLRPRLLLRPDSSGNIGQRGVQGQVSAITPYPNYSSAFFAFSAFRLLILMPRKRKGRQLDASGLQIPFSP